LNITALRVLRLQSKLVCVLVYKRYFHVHHRTTIDNIQRITENGEEIRGLQKGKCPLLKKQKKKRKNTFSGHSH
jgi:hypothetical protein